jgi:uncharacterized protein (TIRG00374 family)
LTERSSASSKPDHPPPRRHAIGDRLEQAIGERADAEQEIERGEAEEPKGRSLTRTAIWLAVTGVSLYLVAPSLIDVFGSADDLSRIDPIWFPVMAVLQAGVFACMWALQRLALHDPPWRPVIASYLAANALSKIAPAGGAVGSALQYRMLVQAGLSRAPVVAGITASNLLTFAVVLALPVFALPAFVRGAVDRNLVEATGIGIGAFVLLLATAVLVLAFDRYLEWLGRTVQRIRNRLRRHATPLTGLPERLVRERNRLLATLGTRWKLALVITVARWALDYATLLAALAAVGATPSPALVLLAFCAAQVLAQIPVTPGGLGFVEAGLTATLALAGVGAGDALLATLAYRLFSYWLPLPLGLVGLALQRREVVPAEPL